MTLLQNIYPGMLVYGCVSEIDNFCVRMALPNSMRGTVHITKVSPAYTELIQQFAEKTETDQDNEGEVTVCSLGFCFSS